MHSFCTHTHTHTLCILTNISIKNMLLNIYFNFTIEEIIPWYREVGSCVENMIFFYIDNIIALLMKKRWEAQKFTVFLIILHHRTRANLRIISCYLTWLRPFINSTNIYWGLLHAEYCIFHKGPVIRRGFRGWW